MASTSSSLASHVGISVMLCATSLWLGYQLGSRVRTKKPEVPTVTDTSVQDEDTEDEDDIADGDLAAVKAGFLEPCKLVLVVRTDLAMTPGKVAAQFVSFDSLMTFLDLPSDTCYASLLQGTDEEEYQVQHWERTGQAKIALKTNSEEQMMELEAIAKSLNLCARSIRDAGHTQVDPGTRTVLGIGPAPVELVNQVTGKLRLF